jgi:thiol:disulfide interchange protein DsbD
MTLLFSFAFGMGFILILIGLFEGLLVNLPKSGKWMVYIKRASAILMIAMGAYFIFTGIRRI